MNVCAGVCTEAWARRWMDIAVYSAGAALLVALVSVYQARAAAAVSPAPEEPLSTSTAFKPSASLDDLATGDPQSLREQSDGGHGDDSPMPDRKLCRGESMPVLGAMWGADRVSPDLLARGTPPAPPLPPAPGTDRVAVDPQAVAAPRGRNTRRRHSRRRRSASARMCIPGDGVDGQARVASAGGDVASVGGRTAVLMAQERSKVKCGAGGNKFACLSGVGSDADGCVRNLQSL